MTTYEVKIAFPVTQVWTYHIEAETEEEAKSLALQGEGDEIDCKLDKGFQEYDWIEAQVIDNTYLSNKHE